jgi:hypothetical protein
MANSIKSQMKTDFQQAKVQGGNRISRIRAIIRDAASQTVAEVKQGSGEIQGIAKGTFSTVVETLTDEPTEPNSDAKSASLTLKQLVAKVFAVVKTKLSRQVKQQATKIDSELNERYGDRYETSKQNLGKGLDQAAERYRQAIATAKAQGSVPLHQKQAEIQEKVGSVGAAAARKEQQIKQYLKSVFQTKAAKL